MGNHGPAYYKRYPKQFEQFTPTCRTNQLEDCSQDEIINAYDNALLYTDYFLAEIISFLKTYDKDHKTAMIFMIICFIPCSDFLLSRQLCTRKNWIF
ncbi:MAG: sulfatase-like hydrolase/transferase [Candidatus Electrothrix sp.]